MKYLYILFLFFLIENTIAQPWQLFQPYQLTYYRNTVDTTEIISVNMDSVIVSGNSSTGLFNQHSYC